MGGAYTLRGLVARLSGAADRGDPPEGGAEGRAPVRRGSVAPVPSAWPVEVVALTPISCGSVLWRTGGGLRLTVIVKATFGLVHEGAARLIAPVELTRKDRHHDKLPSRSLEAPHDLAPYLARAGVVLTGHAHAPAGRPVPAMSVRLMVSRGQPVLDRTVHVFGDRKVADPWHPQPFQRMPLVYERAFGGVGVDENPVGVGADGAALPNLVDPSDPRKPAAFGAIPRFWPARKRLADAGRRRLLEQPIPEIGGDFPWAYLQAAPPEQQVELLGGDEWITVDGMHPSLPRLQTRLSGARAFIHVHAFGPAGAGPAAELALAADTLLIDMDQQRCSVVWRGITPVASEAALATLRIFAAVALPGHPVGWPSPEQIAPPEGDPGPVASAREPEASMGSTVALDLDQAREVAARPAAPFTRALPPPLPPPRPPPARPVSVAPPPAPIEDPASQTQMLSLADLERLSADRPVAPFALATGGPAHDAAPLVGAPWGPRAAPAPAPSGDEDRTALFVLPAPPPAPSASDAAAFFHRIERAPAVAPAPVDRAREPPPRAGEVARIFNASSFTAATIPWQIRPPHDSLTILVKGTFDLVPDAAARPRDESHLPVGDLHLDDDPERSVAHASDFAIRKPRADVTAVGHAVAPGGGSPAMQVIFRFGAGKNRFDRTLHVFGDRHWQRSALALLPTDPRPFQRMPLVYERAFGGPGYDRNPLGVGYKAAAGADGVAPLANLELPGQQVTGPGDAPPPAGFAPIPVSWKERWSKLGTYDRAWFKTRWPYFPEDFDWTYFQSAPAAQQLEHLTGDEPYELVGMHPEHPSLRGRLPGVRARVFVQRTPEAGGAFEEVRLALDTAAFDVDALALDLVWRGCLEVTDEDAPELQHLFVMSEPLAGPSASLEEARRLYLARATPKEPVVETPEEAPANDERPRPVEEPDPEMEKLEQMIAERVEARRALLEAAGLLPPEGAQGDPPPPDPEAIAATLRKGGATEEDVAAVLEALTPPPEDAPGPAAPVGRERALAMLAAGEPFDGVNLEGADLSDLDFSGRSLKRASLRGADLRRAVLAGATLEGALLGGADLSGAVFEDADLTGADLARATIDEARFARANLSAADFSGAAGAGATFAGATGARPRFIEASLRGACFDAAVLASADFTGARLDDASFSGADLARARFYDAVGGHVVFDQSKLRDARFEGSAFLRGSFQGIEADGAVFERATLSEATFHGARLEGASFLRASCLRTVFSTADLSEARLRRADLRGAVLLKANLRSATLERADLTGADLRGANLHSAGLWKAKLEDAKLDRAILTKSTLAVRRPP
jgi:uncharacterized protein YjbI with pentapeptide repeats